MSSQYGELWPTSGWHLLVSLGHPSKFQQVSRLGSITAWQSSSGRQPDFAVLNRGRHLYLARRPSRWAFVHIFSFYSDSSLGLVPGKRMFGSNWSGFFAGCMPVLPSCCRSTEENSKHLCPPGKPPSVPHLMLIYQLTAEGRDATRSVIAVKYCHH